MIKRVKLSLTLATATLLALGSAGQTVEDGNILLYYERPVSALATFQSVLAKDAINAAAWQGLVTAYILNGAPDKAVDTLNAAPTSIWGEPYFKVARGTGLLEKGQVQQAKPFFDGAISDTREKNPGVLSAVAAAHIHATQGDAAYAIELLDKAMRRDKKNADLDVLKGDAYLKMKDGSNAYLNYKNALEKNDQSALAYHRIGQIFLTQKNVPLYTENFKKAIAADSAFAPSLYKMYAYEMRHDPAMAMTYYQQYARHSDASIQNQYDYADLYYINKRYDDAIQLADQIIAREGENTEARLYKLKAYSMADKGDSAMALNNMQSYLAKQQDTSELAQDYVITGKLFAAQKQDSMAIVYLTKAADKEPKPALYQQLAQLTADQKDFAAQALWLGKYYQSQTNPTNIDLFNWGLASLRAYDYQAADTLFHKYTVKYPEQSFGYYWLARARAMQDTTMKEGLAVPAYKDLITVLEKNPEDPNYKNWMVGAYSYLAAYESNTEEDFEEAIDYFEKVLELDPENSSAKKYIGVLEQSLAAKEKS